MRLFLIMIAFLFAIIILALIAALVARSDEKSYGRTTGYVYKAKNHLMTAREEECFRVLDRIFSKKYYVIPQVHLSALFNHEIPGQSYTGAFAHINGKSVDFVLMNKETLRPACAIEIDDYSHNSKKRYERDVEVERIFKEAGFPLMRSREFLHLSDKQIFERVKRAIERVYVADENREKALSASEKTG